ncbi:MAG: hypothetical protein N5P05_000614 [Chroococcopsis gigantea SAG 12.99]|nr:hypothetical protein [Chroococcopsis gigantea SAG 12.99]
MINYCKIFLTLLLFCWCFLYNAPVIAVVERLPLTLISLQEKIAHPSLKDGVSTIDLTNSVIDISDNNKEFRNQFYQTLQSEISRSKQPLGLDFSNSLIQGDFTASRLGIPIALSKPSLPALLSPTEKQQLEQDEKFLSSAGELVSSVNLFRGSLKLKGTVFADKVDFAKTFFLQLLEANEAIFQQKANWQETRFARSTDFSKAIFNQEVNFSENQFFSTVRFRGVHFLGFADFHRSFLREPIIFDGSEFEKLVDFTRGRWLKDASFVGVKWHDRYLFSKSRFFGLLSLRNSTLEKSGSFRSCYFSGLINFQDVKLLDQVDFSNSFFSPGVTLNVPGLAFDSDRAKILGDTGVIGEVIQLPTLEGNETVLRNLVRNFRSFEQIPDANRIEYKTQKLKFSQLRKEIFKISFEDLFSFSWLTKLIKLGFLGLLLLLSQYGTDFSLVIGTGTIIFAYFGWLFWLVDRLRRFKPKPIAPNRYEIVCMLSSYTLLTAIGVFNVFKSSSRPVISLISLSVILIPLPLGLLIRLYQKGRYHDLMNSSYFVQDGSIRQLRLLITRLPVIPEFPTFRERYQPIPWEKRWNWLNYYDLSLNNLLKLGFNDWRVRDEHLPGIVSFLVWYQWVIGVFYISLLIWTLSRTIPGLNLLIYLR